MKLRHVALAVGDEDRSRRFYERYFGFDARSPRRYDDGVLMLYSRDGVALALGPGDPQARLPRFFHFGFVMSDADAVRNLRREFESDAIEIVETVEEPDYVSVKVRDPDEYVVETFWEPPSPD